MEGAPPNIAGSSSGRCHDADGICRAQFRPIPWPQTNGAFFFRRPLRGAHHGDSVAPRNAAEGSVGLHEPRILSAGKSFLAAARAWWKNGSRKSAGVIDFGRC